MNLSRERLLAEASRTGFRAEILEKVVRLLSLLRRMNQHPALNRKDWRTVLIDDISFEAREIRRQLVPLLRQQDIPADRDIETWVEHLVSDCRRLLAAVLPLEPHEREFLDRLLEAGEIVPEILTTDPEVQARIASHPGLQWKALNVRRHRAKRGVELIEALEEPEEASERGVRG